MSTTVPDQPTARRRRPWWQWILIGFAALMVIGFIGSLFDDSDDDTDPPAAAEQTTDATEPTTQEPAPEPTTEEPAPATEEPAPATAEATTAAEEPTTEPEPTEEEFDAEAAREDLLDYIYESNNMRTIEEVCDATKIAEGGWWQCYYDDLEWKSEYRIQVNLTIPGDENPDEMGQAARRWFVNMASAGYPTLEQVTTFVNGLDTGTDYL